MLKIAGSYKLEIGPLIDVAIKPAGRPPAKPFLSSSRSYKFLLDTGASTTCISSRIIEELGLLPTGQMEITTPVGVIKEAQMYSVYVVIFSGGISSLELESQAFEYKGSTNRFEGLIGRDILGKGEFTMSKSGRYTFAVF